MARFQRSLPTQTVKSIVRPKLVEYCASAHQCQFANGDAAHQPVNFAGFATNDRLREVDVPLFAPIFLAHYRSKSIEECLFRTARGFTWMPSKTFRHCAQKNGERDVAAKYFVKELTNALE